MMLNRFFEQVNNRSSVYRAHAFAGNNDGIAMPVRCL
jgi:hypothetical protein